jgi:ferredoxin
MGAIHLVEGKPGRAEIDQRACRRCGACVEACSEEAIMSEADPAIEGELVEGDAELVSLGPQHREVSAMRAMPQALTWLGAALVFAGREIVPRVAASLLDAWDRRASHSATYPSDLQSERSAQRSTTSLPGRGGRRHRHGRRGG